MSKASSKAMTSSTVSSESAPRSSTNEAFGVTSPSSTPNCSTMICFTFSSTAAMCLLKMGSAQGRRPAGLDLLANLRVLLDVLNCVFDGGDLFRIFVGDFEVE